MPCASVGKRGFIRFQTSFDTVVALPFRSMLNEVTISAFVPKPTAAPQRLSGQHVRAIQLAGDDAIQNDLPVRLRLERYIQPFILEEAFLVSDGERRHVGELDEADLQLLLLQLELRGRDVSGAQRSGGHHAGSKHRFQHGPAHFRKMQAKKTPPTSLHAGGMHWSRRRCLASPLLGRPDGWDDESLPLLLRVATDRASATHARDIFRDKNNDLRRASKQATVRY